jgi:hypothetical protein
MLDTNDAGYVMLGACFIGGGAIGWLTGAWRVLRDYERHGGRMDKAYDEGREDERDGGQLRGPGSEHEGAAGPGRDEHDQNHELAGHPRAAEQRGQHTGSGDVPAARPGDAPTLAGSELTEDFLHPDFEQLTPTALDAANTDLPGPDAHSPYMGRPHAEGDRAGELHLEAPLPTVLHLGTEYDGGPQTSARVAWRLWDMTARYELDRARFRAECGLGIAA